MTASSGLDLTLAVLRRSFDLGFAAAPVARDVAFEDLLAIRVAGDPYAIRVREISGVAAGRKVVPLPSRRSDLLGVAAIRGSLAPVYSLAVLLGYGARAEPVSWLALCGSAEPIGLGFEGLESFLRVPRADVHGAVVRVGMQARRIVDVPTVLEKLNIRTGSAGQAKEP